MKPKLRKQYFGDDIYKPIFREEFYLLNNNSSMKCVPDSQYVRFCSGNGLVRHQA